MLISNLVKALFYKIKYLMFAYGILETLKSYYNSNAFTGSMCDILWSHSIWIIFLNMSVR